MPFQGDLQDHELLKLVPFLLRLSTKNDVRPVFQRFQKLCKQERKRRDQSLKLEVSSKMPRATSCTPGAKSYHRIALPENPALNQSDYEVSDNGTGTMPAIRMFETKLLGSPVIEEKLNSFTDFYNQRAQEAFEDCDKSDDPENVVLTEDEEDSVRDTTPRLMGNFSKKSPMHRKRQK